MPVQIRTAGPSDVPRLRELKRAVVDQTWGAGYPPEAVEAWKERFATDAYFRERLGAAEVDTVFHLAGPRDAPTGMSAVRAVEGHAYISDLYVADRGRGTGRRLLRHALDVARSLGLAAAVADVYEGNDAALGLFRSEGFAVEREYVEPTLGARVLRVSRTI